MVHYEEIQEKKVSIGAINMKMHHIGFLIKN